MSTDPADSTEVPTRSSGEESNPERVASERHGDELVVGTVAELPPGSMRLVEVGRYGVGVYNVDGEYYALNNYCPHMGAPVCMGRVTGVAVGDAPGRKRWTREGEILECPWHGWKFAIEDGETLTTPVKRIVRYSVTVRDGMVILGTRPVRPGR